MLLWISGTSIGVIATEENLRLINNSSASDVKSSIRFLLYTSVKIMYYPSNQNLLRCRVDVLRL